MNITHDGLSLIRRFEGFRSRAYKDAAGVWTIGYGHTSNAGIPPVRPLMRITRREGERILARDVDHFARGVERLVKVPLTDGQFSALASFAYNVGLENFRKSSVLRAVNAQDFAAVPRRLSLWVKSRGRVLPGLVNRRAAEAAMFLAETRREPRREAEASATGPCRDTVEPVSGPPLRRSSTSLAAMISALAGVASSLAGGVSDLTRAASSSWIAAAAAFIVVAAAIWIIRERRLKSREDGI